MHHGNHNRERKEQDIEDLSYRLQKFIIGAYSLIFLLPAIRQVHHTVVFRNEIAGDFDISAQSGALIDLVFSFKSEAMISSSSSLLYFVALQIKTVFFEPGCSAEKSGGSLFCFFMADTR
ncbi:MAG: hypothetical protein BWY75_02371 [bacterium ADurb.Bin425]|nr:MAG: hypothetical protein BWY75_02371 [bacterium ADurb.Bin425]